MPEPTPIYMSDKPHEIVPERYVLHYSSCSCTNCGSKSYESSFYALTFIRSRNGLTKIKNLIPCPRPIYNLPVERVLIGRKSTPFCCECGPIDLSYLPDPPKHVPPPRILAEPTIERRPVARKKKPSILDLA